MFFVFFYYQPNIVTRTPVAPYGRIKTAIVNFLFWVKNKLEKKVIV